MKRTSLKRHRWNRQMSDTRRWLRFREPQPGEFYWGWTDWAAGGLQPCQVCLHEGRECDGPIDRHHVVEQRTLRAHGLPHHRWNPAWRMFVCRRRHDAHHRGKRIPRQLVPPAALSLADELGLSYVIERVYPAHPPVHPEET